MRLEHEDVEGFTSLFLLYFMMECGSEKRCYYSMRSEGMHGGFTMLKATADTMHILSLEKE